MPDGEIIHGHRHNNCYDVVRARPAAKTEDGRLDIVQADQGFVTSAGRFVEREEAMQIQMASGRPSRCSNDGSYQGTILFSEDLY